MNSDKSNPPNNDETNASVDHLFRHNAGRMTAVMVRTFGIERIDLVEDAIQDAMIRALRTWPFRGTPDRPEAWLITVARNSIIDKIRRERRVEPLDEIEPVSGDSIETRFADELAEDVLRMMFACCHPRISPDSQVALTLRTVGGFNVREIASAFLSTEESIAKLIARAKRTLRDTDLEIPPPQEIAARIEPVLKTLYLMFNEGYNASSGTTAARHDLCFEAIRLARILAAHPRAGHPKVNALLALFLFQTARLGARFDEAGDILRLSEQDRNQWNKKMIREAILRMRSSAVGNEVSEFHLEAEIASIHAVASDFRDTDWQRLVECYDRLLERRPSPIVALNRTVAYAKIAGAESALRELEPLREQLNLYPLFHITIGDLQLETGAADAADESFRRALALNGNDAMYRFLRRRIAS